MSGMFSKPKAPPVQTTKTVEVPKTVVVPQQVQAQPTVRMPTATDPETLDAAQRTRSKALRRKGRLSTILTDHVRSMTGSSGTKLGA